MSSAGFSIPFGSGSIPFGSGSFFAMGGGVDFGRTFGAAAIVMALGYKNKTRFHYISYLRLLIIFLYINQIKLTRTGTLGLA